MQNLTTCDPSRQHKAVILQDTIETMYQLTEDAESREVCDLLRDWPELGQPTPYLKGLVRRSLALPEGELSDEGIELILYTMADRLHAKPAAEVARESVGLKPKP